ncbi:MAG TPA: 3',5'-cyclic-nucleotide phosphodiesterase [Syntrophales bacterium]|nr:3',5'-cyclic-nucleotide phosphodiesterase [Syntrophales bacterium]
MEIRVLGCHGSQLPGFNTTSFLINGTVLVDAGTVTSVLTADEQKNIDYIFVTHAHLDHVRDIMFLADNMFYLKKTRPLAVLSAPGIIETLKRCFFNGVVWPDFSVLPNANNPVLKFSPLAAGETISLAGLNITAIAVNHTVESFSYVVQAKEGSVIFVGDTGPTEEIWKIAGKISDLKAIFVETSFSDTMQDVAEITGHLTPSLLLQELKKMDALPTVIYLYHMKPLSIETIKGEIRLLKNSRLRALEDGQVLQIGA